MPRRLLVTSLGGPLHGTAYPTVIALTWATTPVNTTRGARSRSVIPGVGGLLVLRRHRGSAHRRRPAYIR